MPSKNTTCLWCDGTVLEAAQFYAETFPDGAVGLCSNDADDQDRHCRH
jgi:2-polyprenyl-6-hydroxyphenyl methylase/3-demethylubiquinone-9 3-methyltransferase